MIIVPREELQFAQIVTSFVRHNIARQKRASEVSRFAQYFETERAIL
jgi:hypothetical protein